MQRLAHETLGVQKYALLADESHEFALGERVLTVDGVMGKVTAVLDGPYSRVENYEVELDNGLGGGLYSVSQLSRVTPRTASVEDPEAMAAEASVLHVAVEDYPELGDILSERPPIENIRVFAKTGRLSAITGPSEDVGQPDACSFCGSPEFDEFTDTGRGARARCAQCNGTMTSNGSQWQPDLPSSPENEAAGTPDHRAIINDLSAVHAFLDYETPRASFAEQVLARYELLGRDDQEAHAAAANPATDAVTYLATHPAAYDPDLGFHLQATWADVRNKARTIRDSGGVRILAANSSGVVGEVRGEHHLYESSYSYIPTTRKIASWSCGCKWGAYTWGRSPAYARFEGRQCSHVTALQYEAQSRGMFGRTVQEDFERLPGQYQRSPVTVQYDPSRDENINRRTVPPGNMGRSFASRHEAVHARDLAPVHVFALEMVRAQDDPDSILTMLARYRVPDQQALSIVRWAAQEATAPSFGGSADPGTDIPGMDTRDTTELKKKPRHHDHHTNDARAQAPDFGRGIGWFAPGLMWCDQCNGSGCGHCGGTGQVMSGVAPTGAPGPGDASTTSSPIAAENPDAGDASSSDGLSATSVWLNQALLQQRTADSLMGSGDPAQTYHNPTSHSDSQNPGSTGWATSVDPKGWVHPIIGNGLSLAAAQHGTSDICGGCGEHIHATGYDDVPWVHSHTGNSYCDVHSTNDAALLAGSPLHRPEAQPVMHEARFLTIDEVRAIGHDYLATHPQEAVLAARYDLHCAEEAAGGQPLTPEQERAAGEKIAAMFGLVFQPETHDFRLRSASKIATWSRTEHPQPIVHVIGQRPPRPLQTGDTLMHPESGYSAKIEAHSEGLLQADGRMYHRRPMEGDHSRTIFEESPEDRSEMERKLNIGSPAEQQFLKNNPQGPSKWSSKKDVDSEPSFDPPTVSGVALKAHDTGRVLMIQRSMNDQDDPAAGTWEFPGGHHEEGDLSSLHAGIREWQEEVGQPFPEGGHVAHTWRSGPYMGHVVVVPSEDGVKLKDGRTTTNPDDPDGDDHEQSAWWHPDHAKANPALRPELKKANPFGDIKKAAAISTPCQTPEVNYDTTIGDRTIGVTAEMPMDVDLDTRQAETLDNNLHNMMEMVLAPLFPPAYEPPHKQAVEYGGARRQAELHDEPEAALPQTDSAEEVPGTGWQPGDPAPGQYLAAQPDIPWGYPGGPSQAPEPQSKPVTAASLDEVPFDQLVAAFQATAAGQAIAREDDDSGGGSERAMAMSAAATTSRAPSSGGRATYGGATYGGGSGRGAAPDDSDIAAMARRVLAGEVDITEEGISKSGMKDFNFAEQQELINEGSGVQARNFGDLQIQGTHYAMMEDDPSADDLLWL